MFAEQYIFPNKHGVLIRSHIFSPGYIPPPPPYPYPYPPRFPYYRASTRSHLTSTTTRRPYNYNMMNYHKFPEQQHAQRDDQPHESIKITPS